MLYFDNCHFSEYQHCLSESLHTVFQIRKDTKSRLCESRLCVPLVDNSITGGKTWKMFLQLGVFPNRIES